jgi:hypothetical protein
MQLHQISKGPFEYMLYRFDAGANQDAGMQSSPLPSRRHFAESIS